MKSLYDLENQPNPERQSGLEFLRILAMILIIAHHLVNNSGISHCYDYSNPSWRMFLLLVWGMWGKTAINAFVLITGYFMCERQLTLKRFLKLFCEIYFYTIIMYCVLFVAGYEKLTVSRVLNVVAWPFRGVNDGFSCSFMWLYLFIPFLNELINKLDKRSYFRLVGISVLLFTGTSTFFDNRVVFHFVGWYMTVYLVGALLRKYPFDWMSSFKKCGIALLASVLAVWGFMGAVYLFATRYHRAFINPNYLTEDSHKLFALMIGVLVFLTFKNLNIGCRRWINVIASTTFGVLLIHAGSDGMRTWLWKDFLHVKDWYTLPLGEMVGRMVVWPFVIFAVCSALDYLRIILIERPFFRMPLFSTHSHA